MANTRPPQYEAPARSPPQELKWLIAWNQYLNAADQTIIIEIPAAELLSLLKSHWKLRCDAWEIEDEHKVLRRRTHIYSIMAEKMSDLIISEVPHGKMHCQTIQTNAIKKASSMPTGAGAFDEKLEVQWIAKSLKVEIPECGSPVEQAPAASKEEVEAIPNDMQEFMKDNHPLDKVADSESPGSELREHQLTPKELKKRHKHQVKLLNEVSRRLEVWNSSTLWKHMEWRFGNDERAQYELTVADKNHSNSDTG